ncbi:hypothetical protein [Azospirillum canadense]|uniref:hypothetical protein n=1 Tax=Azospirillum canadense TaxID=403962 RepID=UPI002227E502|nr:hypothetical protein [Azospirillum canadense]MCW2241519.1 TolB-like protein [Azospirillum canadense]
MDNIIPRELIVAALERILASREFRNSTRNRRFIQFVVNEALAGRSDHIKAYAIALDVFNRNASFDPMLDPVVRIQAGRVRRSLERYYDTEGADAQVRITIPKGSYVPHFFLVGSNAPHVNAPHALDQQSVSGARNLAPPFAAFWRGAPKANQPVATPSPWSELTARTINPRLVLITAAALVFVTALLVLMVVGGPVRTRLAVQEPSFSATRAPSLMVLPFTNGAGDPAQDVVADGFAEDLAGALVRSQRVRVFGADNHKLPPSPLHKARPDVPMDYVLRGSISQSGEQVQVTTVLSDGQSRRYLWADDIRREAKPDTMIAVRQDIAVEVARALTQPKGVFDTEAARGSLTRPLTALSTPECGSFRKLMPWIGLTALC